MNRRPAGTFHARPIIAIPQVKNSAFFYGNALMTKKQLTNGQPDGTWFSDPAHFRRPSRRDFLYVGMIGGLGVTLGGFFTMPRAAKTGPAPLAEPPKASP